MRMSERGIPVIKTALNANGNFSTTSDGVNMKNYSRCMIVYLVTTSGASSSTITLLQGTTATATTALGYTEYSENTDCLSNLATWTKVTGTTLTTAAPGTATYGYMWEVKASELDTDTFGSENTFIRLNVASSANVTAASLTYYMYEPNDARSTDGMPAAS